MKKQIFYFSGTGNSLAVAKGLRDSLGDRELYSIPLSFTQAAENCEKDIVIVTPIYMYNIPHMVGAFLKALNGRGYCSVVLTGGGEAGKSINSVKKLLSSSELKLTSFFNIPMPNNYTPFGLTPEDVVTKQLGEMKSRLKDMAGIISSHKEHSDHSGTGFFRTWFFPGILYGMGYKYIPFLDKSFNANDNCTGCGICLQVCPADNIILEEKKPRWQKRCQQCFACLQWCPEEAIQYGDKTSGSGRYRNPDIELKEIIESNGKNREVHL